MSEEIGMTPERAMWIDVVVLAISDLTGPNISLARQAASWIFDPIQSSDRETVCEFAGTCEYDLQIGARARLKEKPVSLRRQIEKELSSNVVSRKGNAARWKRISDLRRHLSVVSAIASEVMR